MKITANDTYDYDSLWKEGVELYFKELMPFFSFVLKQWMTGGIIGITDMRREAGDPRKLVARQALLLMVHSEQPREVIWERQR